MVTKRLRRQAVVIVVSTTIFLVMLINLQSFGILSSAKAVAEHSTLMSLSKRMSGKIPLLDLKCLYTENIPQTTRSTKYFFNCTNINQIEITKSEVGGGRSKSVSIGMFKGEKVVIKRLSKVKQPKISHHHREVLFLKEILIRAQLTHPNLIKMYGFCISSIEDNSYKDFKTQGDILAVYEYGEEFVAKDLNLTTGRRLKHALELADLLLYLQNSPLGSLIIGDFHRNHFLMVDNKIKLIDLDYMHNIEHPCRHDVNKTVKCPFHLPCIRIEDGQSTNQTCDTETKCSVGVCVGYNAKLNMHTVYGAFLKYFLQKEYYPPSIQEAVANLSTKIHVNMADAEYVLGELNAISLNL